MSNSTTNEAVGVQQLIDRLKTDGVQQGQQQAEALLTEAKQQAAAIIDEARSEADKILRDAQQQSERIETNGKRALSLAARDASLQLKEQLQREFRGWIGALVQSQIDAPEFLGEVIREMAKQAITTVSDAADGKSQSPGKLTALISGDRTESVDAFVKGQTAEMFRHGVEVQPDPSVDHGFRIRIEGKEVEIDFTDEAVTAAMMRFLAPKFRQLIGSGEMASTNE